MNTKHLDILKVLGWLATIAGVIIPATHWDPATAALGMGLAHSIGSYVQAKLPA